MRSRFLPVARCHSLGRAPAASSQTFHCFGCRSPSTACAAQASEHDPSAPRFSLRTLRSPVAGQLKEIVLEEKIDLRSL